MPCTVHLTGFSVDAEESANLVRRRVNNARKMLMDYNNGNLSGEGKEKFEPESLLTFTLVDTGEKFFFNVEKYVWVQSMDGSDNDAEEE